jgi:hypothetical protein
MLADKKASRKEVLTIEELPLGFEAGGCAGSKT